jgi:hypothetical protein
MGLGPSGAAEVVKALGPVSDLLNILPIAGMYEAAAVDLVLRAHGLATLGSLIGLSGESLASRTGIVRSRADAIVTAVRRLASLPATRLLRVLVNEDDGSAHLPCVPSRIIAALAMADTLEEEVYSLALQPNVDDALLVLRWWGLPSWPPPTFRQLAAERGLTAERVRQIVLPHERRLCLGGVRPPIATALAMLLLGVGPGMPPVRLAEASAEQGLIAELDVLRTLPALAGAGLIGGMHIQFRSGLLKATRT